MQVVALSPAPARSRRRTARPVWAVLGYNLLVVLWGAFVRATGSGAGCGNHWPLCNGVVIPREAQLKTLIEFGHRATSGLAGVAVLAMLVWTWRAFPSGHPARRGAVWSTVLMLVEGALGAGLVRLELVAENSSLLRAFSMSAHLVNTFLLLGAITLTGWWAAGGGPFRFRGSGPAGGAFAAAILGTLLVGVTGAIAALGDTLFPARSLAEGFRQDLSPTANLLLRLRVLHPFVAVSVGAGLLLLARRLHASRPDPGVRRLALALGGLVSLQLIAGALNLALLVPIPMQLLHLLLADGVWIALVLLAAAALRPESRSAAMRG